MTFWKHYAGNLAEVCLLLVVFGAIAAVATLVGFALWILSPWLLVGVPAILVTALVITLTERRVP